MAGPLDLTYQYSHPSRATSNGVHLAASGGASPCPELFTGKVAKLATTTAALAALSDIGALHFASTSTQLRFLRDPICNAIDGRISFEALSHCATTYARLEIDSNGLSGEFPEPGSSNVDINSLPRGTLRSIDAAAPVRFFIGGTPEVSPRMKQHSRSRARRDEPAGTIISLDRDWLYAIDSSQALLASMEQVFELDQVAAERLLSGLPRARPLSLLWLVDTGRRLRFTRDTPIEGVPVSGVERLQPLTELLPHLRRLTIHRDRASSTCAWVAELSGNQRFISLLSESAAEPLWTPEAPGDELFHFGTEATTKRLLPF